MTRAGIIRLAVLVGAVGALEAACRAAFAAVRSAATVPNPVSRPDAGGTTCTPRSVSVATLAWVAGCSHISVCIAGANTTGQRAVSRVLVSRSSARPS